MKSINQKLLIIVFVFIVLVQISIFAQANYTAKKTATKPKIGKGIDAIWSQVKMVPVNKPVDDRNRTVQKKVSPSDYSMEWGMTWDDDGLYFLGDVTRPKDTDDSFYSFDSEQAKNQARLFAEYVLKEVNPNFVRKEFSLEDKKKIINDILTLEETEVNHG